MDTIAYKYFTFEGQRADETVAQAKDLSAAHKERISALLQKYEADCLWGGSRTAPHAIGYLWERPEDNWRAKPPMRENFLKPAVEHSDGKSYACYTPDQRYKAGKAIKAELKAVGYFSFSEFMTKTLGLDRHVFGVLDGRMVMCQSAAGQYGNKLVFRVPVGGDYGDTETFTAPEGFKEIKKSEFIAITEEGE